MAEETVKEITSAGEPPRGLISSEFFFLLQRIDRLDEKFEAKFGAMEAKLDGVKFWAIGAVITVIVGFAGTIVTLLLLLK